MQSGASDEEHWRLLYVAATRAEEKLVIGGALGPRARGIPPPESWYAELVEGALIALGAQERRRSALDRCARHYHGIGGPWRQVRGWSSPAATRP
jgi:ATP-dependent helicase/nuclease subunit A